VTGLKGKQDTRKVGNENSTAEEVKKETVLEGHPTTLCEFEVPKNNRESRSDLL
jgi:hypothetical protein